MIFIAGVHGVGKSTLSKKLEEELGIKCYRASSLIESGGNKNMPVNKEICNIDGNQKILEQKISQLVNERGVFLLEGHLCLINGQGKIQQIPKDIFRKLQLEIIWVLVDDPEKIAMRNWDKSYLLSSAEYISEFQNREITYGKEIAKYLDIPFVIIDNRDDGMNKIKGYIRERMYCGINSFVD